MMKTRSTSTLRRNPKSGAKEVSLHLRTIAIIKDVFAVWAQAKKAIYENKLSVKTFNVKTVGPGEVDKELAFNGYDGDPTLFLLMPTFHLRL